MKLTGEKAHWCPDWDFLLVDETMPEYDACTCFGPKDPQSYEIARPSKSTPPVTTCGYYGPPEP
jgi:hypothetical protein